MNFFYRVACSILHGTAVLVRRLYCLTFVNLMFVPSDFCGSDVCTGTGTAGEVISREKNDDVFLIVNKIKV